jgi:hypothetical protein
MPFTMKPFIIILFASASTQAAFTINLPGNTESSGWDNLKSSNPYWSANGYTTAYPGSAAWPAPVAANAAGSQGSAVFMKISGNGYFGSSSVYDGGGAGMFSVSDASPLANLATVVFQLDTGTTVGVLPTLSYNGGNQSLPANFFAQGNGEYSTFDFSTGQAFPTQNRAWQWDLTGLGATSYEIKWGSVANNHLTQYEIHLTTGDSFAQAVPEPSAAMLGALASLALLRRRRQ